MRAQSEHVKQLVELYRLNQTKMIEETDINYKALVESGFDANSGKQEEWGFGNKTKEKLNETRNEDNHNPIHRVD